MEELETNRTAIIVGDSFSKYAELDGVYTVSGFAKMILSVIGGMVSPDYLPSGVIWGQGIGEYECEYISHIALALDESIAPDFIGQLAIPATRGHAHKRGPQNVLISVPERENDTRFVSDLIIDSRNELLIDHVSGQHVQGMILLEACRQMFLAVTEEYFLKKSSILETYFVIKSMAIDFKSFVFPVGAKVTYSLGTLNQKTNGRLAVDAVISIWQNDNECATCTVSYSVFDATELSARELGLARKSISNALTEDSSLHTALIESPNVAIPTARNGARKNLRVDA